MDRDAINARLAAILTTLAEMGGSAPETPIYLALGCDHGLYMQLRLLLTAGGLCTLAGNTLTLTEKGHAVAAKCNAALHA